MTDHDQRLIRRMAKLLDDVRKAPELPARIEIEGEAAPELAELAAALNRFFHDFQEAGQFFSKLNLGQLDAALPSGNAMAGPVGELQNKLRTVVEQIKKASEEEFPRYESTPEIFSKALDALAQSLQEKKAAEQALKESERRYRLLADNTEDIIWTMNLNHELTYCSPSCVKLTGLTEEEALETPMEQTMTTQSWELFQQISKKRRDAPMSVQRAEIELYRADGSTIWVESVSKPLLDEEGRLIGVLGVSRDITERKQAEKLREDMERISRHDIKAPLNAVINLPELLLSDDNLTEDQRDILLFLQEEGRAMLNLINLSQDLCRMEQGTYQPCFAPIDMVKVLTRISRELTPLMERRNARILVDNRLRARGSFFVRGEELLCYALLSNLVKNALEACRPEETVTITLSDAGDLQRIEIHNPTPVPKAVRDRFFEKYATYGKSGGMGLGAYSARLMAETLGGLVTMRTSESEGCTVTIALLPS